MRAQQYDFFVRFYDEQVADRPDNAAPVRLKQLND